MFTGRRCSPAGVPARREHEIASAERIDRLLGAADPTGLGEHFED
jgi:hypothetical protein